MTGFSTENLSDFSTDSEWPVVVPAHPAGPNHNPEQSPPAKLADALVDQGYIR